MWSKVGLRRQSPDLQSALQEIHSLKKQAAEARGGDERTYNLVWQHTLDLRNQVTVAEIITCSALERDESRGSHYRDDFPETKADGLYNVFMRLEDGQIRIERRPVQFTRLRPTSDVTAMAMSAGIFVD
jgi:succinate dehydrogenase/fumarate reductase flavoprotein subunit